MDLLVRYIEKYWVHIVAGRHRQVKGINYNETFSAAVKMPSVCVVLANAAEQDWEIHQIDMRVLTCALH